MAVDALALPTGSAVPVDLWTCGLDSRVVGPGPKHSEMSDSDDDIVANRRPRPTQTHNVIAAANAITAIIVIDSDDDDILVPNISPDVIQICSDSDEDESISLRELSAQFSRTRIIAPPPVVVVAPVAITMTPPPTDCADPWSLCSDFARLAGGFSVARSLFDRLFPYQREGIAWMWSLHADAPVAAGSLGRATERATSGVENSAATAAFVKPHTPATTATATAAAAIAPSLASVAYGDAKISGGILADDMGLGKTVQTVTFLAGLLGSRKRGNGNGAALIVLPVSLLETWRVEFARFAPTIAVTTLHEQTGLAARATAVRRAAAGGGVLLTTYGLVSSTPSLFGADPNYCDDEVVATEIARAVGVIKWAALVLDEGHRVKNPSTAAARSVRSLPAHYRLLLTGTPIQNNLEELWGLYDCIACGRLLDTRPVFNSSLGNRIAAARDRRSTAAERFDGAEATAALMAIVSPYLLRREKDKLLALPLPTSTTKDTFTTTTTTAAAAAVEDADTMEKSLLGKKETAMGTMGSKKEIVIWVPFAPAQATLYRAYLALSAEVRAALGGGDEAAEVGKKASNGTGDFVLSAIMNLRKLATHPILLTRAKLAVTYAAAVVDATDAETLAEPTVSWIGMRAKAHADAVADAAYDSNGEERVSGAAMPPPIVEPAWSAADLPNAEALVAASGKLQALVLLLRRAAIDGHKALVFSQHTRTLDIVEKVLSRLFTLNGIAAGVAGLDGASDLPAPAFAKGSGGRKLLWKRIDGTLKPEERTAAVRVFNTDPSVAFCLLSTGVGALGLTLTAATRVILLDISWNPATDQQAVDRAYRVGQMRDVVTYRLITAGTVEEKMYRLQMFKSGLSTSVMGARGAVVSAPATASAMRFLSKSDIKNLFELGATDYSETQRLVDAVIAPPPVVSREISDHLAVLAAPPHSTVAVGLSHHDGLFSLHPEAVAAIQEQLAERAQEVKGGRAQEVKGSGLGGRGLAAKTTTAAIDEKHDNDDDDDNDDDNEVEEIQIISEDQNACIGEKNDTTFGDDDDAAAELAELAELRAMEELYL